jgi:hypothetical protein
MLISQPSGRGAREQADGVRFTGGLIGEKEITLTRQKEALRRGAIGFRPPFSCQSFLERWLINRNTNDTGAHHAERTRRAHRHIDDPAPHEWTAIIDPALDRVPGVRHCDNTSERPGSMGTCHFAPVASTTVIGGETGLGFACSSH